MMVIMLAESDECIMRWCTDKGLDPTSKNIRIVTQPEGMRGFSAYGLTIVTLCRWWNGKSHKTVQFIQADINLYEEMGAQRVSAVCDEHKGVK